MELKELFNYRQQFLAESKDADGYISDYDFLSNCLIALNETKFIDTTDLTDIYCCLEKDNVKINAYTLNESGERLQLFIVNTESLSADDFDQEVMVSVRTVYEKYFAKAINFLKKAIKRQLEDLVQDNDPSRILMHQLATSGFIDQIDVVEIFLLSASATIQRGGAEITTKTIEFEDEEIGVSFTREGQKHSKNLLIIRSVIDLNFLYNVYIAQKGQNPLTINFSDARYKYYHPLTCLNAAVETSFNSYLCVLPATLLAELYKYHSSRLLEKNVRSFLQLRKDVNQGMVKTIRKEPEKFIAYNNGLTITAIDSELEYDNGLVKIKALTDFQIVNGGQTTATLYFSQKMGLNIDQVRVMAKINVAKDASDESLDELITNISAFSNAQSRVSKADLRTRSPQLIKIKSLSESVLTPSGKKWFFESAKGQYLTMLRMHSGNTAKFEKAYPKERRFPKEDMAKYYTAWGDKPYIVKNGGEKVFRLFIEEISGEGKNKKPFTINRAFYEDMIARTILFRSLETIYGAGKNSLGQLRSAVVPYSIAAVYSFTTGDKKAQPFDLLKIWKAENLDDGLKSFFKSLMQLMNKLIIQYGKSDDKGEYAKRSELWNDIVDSNELVDFLTATTNNKIIAAYRITAEELKKREKESSKSYEMDFELLLLEASIFDKGDSYYNDILRTVLDLNPTRRRKIEMIVSCLQNYQSIDDKLIYFEKELLNELAVSNPDFFDKKHDEGHLYKRTADYIVKKYNSAVSLGNGIEYTFNSVKEIAGKKGAKYYSVFGEIGKALSANTLPTMTQIRQASEYVRTFIIL